MFGTLLNPIANHLRNRIDVSGTAAIPWLTYLMMVGCEFLAEFESTSRSEVARNLIEMPDAHPSDDALSSKYSQFQQTNKGVLLLANPSSEL